MAYLFIESAFKMMGSNKIDLIITSKVYDVSQISPQTNYSSISPQCVQHLSCKNRYKWKCMSVDLPY